MFAYVVALSVTELAGRIRAAVARVALATVTDVWSEREYTQNKLCAGLVTE